MPRRASRLQRFSEWYHHIFIARAYTVEGTIISLCLVLVFVVLNIVF